MRAKTPILTGGAGVVLVVATAFGIGAFGGWSVQEGSEAPIKLAAPVVNAAGDAKDLRIRKLANDLGHSESQKAARAELLSIGTSATAVLFECMQDADPVIRWELASLQGEIQDTRALMPLVIAVLNDPHEAVRERAMWALQQFSENRAAIVQLKQSLDSGDDAVRWRAALALAKLGERDGASIIRDGLGSPEHRSVALKAIIEIVDEDAIATIAQIFPDLDAIDRQQAIMIYGKHGGAVAVDALIGALTDPISDVRWRVCYFLSRIGDRRAITALKELKASETDERVLKHADKALLALERLRR